MTTSADARATDSQATATQVTVARLWVYPIKSCAGVAVQSVDLCETGFDLDRAWMVVDDQGEFLTQREHPRMALIRPQIKQHEVILRAPGMLALHLDLERVEQPTRARVWNDVVSAYDMGDVAARWMSMAITDGKENLRLVRFDPEHQRLANVQWTKGVAAPTQFPDGYPILVCTESSVAELNAKLVANGQAAVDIDRFRPNLTLAGLPAHDEDHIDTLQIGDDVTLKLVKPCTRCSMPDVNPADASTGSSVAQALASYRADARMQGAITFGMNAIITRAEGAAKLKLGDAVGVSYGV
jgi:uncharacterized protein